MADPRSFLLTVGEPLPAAVAGGRADLPAHIVKEVNAIGRPRQHLFLLWAGIIWASMIGAAWLSLALWHMQGVPWALKALGYVLAVLFIGTRMLLFGLLMHEQAHRSGIKGKWGDYIANALTAFWLLVTVEGYRKVHMAHHGNYFTENDPDFIRKQGVEWEFPQPAWVFLRTLARDASGLNLPKLLKGKKLTKQQEARDQRAVAFRIGFYGVLALLLTLVHGWGVFALYWGVPFLCVLPMCVRWLSLCEHRYNLVNPGLGESTPLIMLSPVERFLLPMFNFNYHIYHHFFPYISAVDLPKVHRIFQREGLVQEAHVFHGYLHYLRFLFQPRAVETTPHSIA